MEWEELPGTSAIWHPEKKGDAIEGTVIKIEETQYGKQITLEKDNVQFITPSHKVLQSRLSNVKVEDYIKIVFEGQELPTTKGKQGTMIYKVLRGKRE